MRKNALLGFILLVCIHGNVHAQVATLGVADTSGAPGSANVPVNIKLDNTMSVAGVQFTLTFDGSLLTATKADTTYRSTNMSVASNIWDDSVKVLMYSVAGDSILPGTGAIAKILFDIDSSAVAGDSVLLHLKDAILSDPHAQPISVTTNDGWLHFVSVGVSELSKAKPNAYMLGENVPNPFNQLTVIRYQLPVESKVNLKIYSIAGRLVRTLVDKKQEAGYYRVSWDGRDDSGERVAAGVYFYKLKAHGTQQSYTETRKLILVR